MIKSIDKYQFNTKPTGKFACNCIKSINKFREQLHNNIDTPKNIIYITPFI